MTEPPRRWPFTDDEFRSLWAAYEALTRVGNATADRVVNGPDTDWWDPLLDLAHHRLGLVLAMSGADAVEARGAGARYTCGHCGRVSSNPTDRAEGYCGGCHRWASDVALDG